MLCYQDKINILTKDLESQRLASEEKSYCQNRAFDSLKQLEAEKAEVSDELAQLKMRLEEVQNENVNLHQVAQDANLVHEEKLQLNSMLAQIQADNECLLKENEYYKDDLMPTMRAKSKEMQRKFEEYQVERQNLLDENQNMKSTDSEQLEKERQAHQVTSLKLDALTAQLSALKLQVDEQLAKQSASDLTIQGQ